MSFAISLSLSLSLFSSKSIYNVRFLTKLGFETEFPYMNSKVCYFDVPAFYMNGLSCHVVCMMFQGPLGWQSLSGLPVGQSLLDRDMEFFINADEHVEIGAVSWEATIQKHVEEELYNSSLEVCASYFFLDT